jgi:hypothetical protein
MNLGQNLGHPYHSYKRKKKKRKKRRGRGRKEERLVQALTFISDN